MKRKIIKIDENLCNGCGNCIPDCKEGALQLIEGKARLVSDLFCDGLGACLGSCPQGAITIEEREAEAYSEKSVIEQIIPQGEAVLKAHLKHLDEHNETKFLEEAIETLRTNNIEIPKYKELKVQGHLGGCPGSRNMSIKRTQPEVQSNNTNVQSQLQQWPIQLKLINPDASFFDNSDILIAADCTAFAYGNFHNRFLKNKVLIMFCPKLDTDLEVYIDKLSHIFKSHDVNSVTILRMEVPCCGGVSAIVKKAIEDSGKVFMVKENIISINGEIV